MGREFAFRRIATLVSKNRIPVEGAMPPTDPSLDPAIDHFVRAFLKVLNSGGGEPLEQLAPQAARAALVNLQSSVKLDLPPAQVSELSITQDGQKIELTIVRPAGEKKTVPAFMSQMAI